MESKYLKFFGTHSEYSTYITGATKILPNVSFCQDNHEVHYSPWVETRIVAKYNVTSTSSSIMLIGSNTSDNMSDMEIDGVLQDSVQTSYRFTTTGEHTVKYTPAGTTLGASAFANCSNMTSVFIPNSITSIGNYAFRNCTELTMIDIGNSMTSFGQNCFQYCTKLTRVIIHDIANWCGVQFESGGNPISTAKHLYFKNNEITNLTIPNTVTSIGATTFAYCLSLNSLVISDSVTSIGNSAFSSCSNLTSVTFGNSLITIGSAVFENCSSLTNFTLPNSVTTINSHAFLGCSSLTSFTLPASVTTCGTSSYPILSGCSNLVSITVDPNNNTYDSRNNCNAIIETATNKIINGCQTTVIPNTVTTIGSSAFEYHTTLTSMSIPESVTTIEDYAFQYCSGLLSVSLPASLTSMGRYVFSNCTNLTEIHIHDLGAFFNIPMVYGSNFLENRHLYLNDQEVHTLTVPNTVTSIGSYLFYRCPSITSVTIPSTVTSIGEYAFSSCSNLASVTVEATTPPTLGSGVFSSNASNRIIYVPSASVSTYKAANGWKTYASYIQAIPQS